MGFCEGKFGLLKLFCVVSSWQLGTTTAGQKAESLTTFKQGWQHYCKDKHRCRGLPPVPQRAYVISLPQDSSKRDVLLPRLEDYGLDVEVVDGILRDQVHEDANMYAPCKAAKNSQDCQAGLTFAHMEAWKRLISSGEPAAWVLEDDVVFHDNVTSLLPQYWAKAPRGFQLIFVGYVQPEHWQHRIEEEVVVAPPTTPYGTHAYIIKAETAERMALYGEYIVGRSKMNDGDKTPWSLDGDDIKIDHFIKNFYEKLLPKEEQHRWAIFDSTLKTPWTYRNITTPGNAHCTCECNDIEACIREGKAPIKQSGGLATQHLCGKYVENFMRWQEEISTLQGEPERLCNSSSYW